MQVLVQRTLSAGLRPSDVKGLQELAILETAQFACVGLLWANMPDVRPGEGRVF